MRPLSRLALLVSLVAPVSLAAQQPNDTTHRAGWNWDLSNVLSSRRGFIPVPFAFGDPVVGFGGGLGLIFYRPPAVKSDTVNMRRPPASSGIGGFYTGQSAWGFAGGLYRPWHGDRGPIPITRYLDQQPSEVHAAALAAFDALGYPLVDDHNAPNAMGIGPMPMSTREGRRVVSLDAYLPLERPVAGLTIRPDSLARSDSTHLPHSSG